MVTAVPLSIVVRAAGREELPRWWRGRAGQRLAPTGWAIHPRSGIRVRRWGA